MQTPPGPAMELMTVSEVADLLRVSKMTVYRLVHSGELPALRVGRSFRMPRSGVVAYLRSCEVDGAADHQSA